MAGESGEPHRKTVTVLFCDLAGSTELGERVDTERLRGLLSAYFERMQGIAERHGGQVEKFIGDAVVAVFGIPVLHEDDALRALRAAVEMRAALPELGLAGRIGVTTGEVVTASPHALAIGDALNVAARLQQAAAPGEVLVGGPTTELTGDAAVLEAVEPLALKGKTRPVPAFRLVDVREPSPRLHVSGFVGRERELRLLRESWERVSAERRCELVTVVGDAGVGKSRLVAEFLRSVDATAVRGRCLPYGEGITYWPVVEILKQLDALPKDDAAAAAVRSLLGHTRASTSADEIAWAVRKTLEQVAELRPVVVVFDDIQWGEETFLDLVEHVALLSVRAPILVLCMARPELRDRRADWPVTTVLAGLDDGEVEALLPAEMPAEQRMRIARAAGGNPLFVEEMVAVAAGGNGEVVVPPTLQALLGARLDQLEATHRSVLECAAIEGEVFHRGAVEALMTGETRVTPHIARLVRQHLIVPERPQLAGEDGFRFRHLLIRDAAYESLPKAARADLHVRFAAWLEERGADLVELDEILGYHREQALQYRAELGLQPDEELAASARDRLSSAGYRAYNRLDYGAAVSLLQRAATTLPAGTIDLRIEAALIDAAFWRGHLDAALERAKSLVRRGRAAEDRISVFCGVIKSRHVTLYTHPEGVANRLDNTIHRALPVFHAADAQSALYIAYSTLAWVKHHRARTQEALAAIEQAVTYFPAASGDLVAWQSTARMDGPTPVADFLAWLEEPEQRRHRSLWLDMFRARSLGMLGRIEEARSVINDVRRTLVERGDTLEVAMFTGTAAQIEDLAGDPASAVKLLQDECEQLQQLGEQGFLSTASACLAQLLCQLERLDEADDWAAKARTLGASDDVETQYRWRLARAVILARSGDSKEAEDLAREAISLAETTDNVDFRAGALASLGEVLDLVGKPDQAAETRREALARYERKGNVAMSRRIRAQLRGTT